MSEVASAYVSLMFSARGAGPDIERQLNGELGSVGQRQGKQMGGKLTGALGGVMKKSLIGIGAAGGTALGTALFKGFNRLSSIEQAEASLTGLGHSAASVDKIMSNALASVEGTAFGLGDAASVAASVVAAGVKPGQDLERTLKLVGDAATIAGTDLSSMGAIFGKAAAANKVQMDIINQLHDAGVPALALLADQMGVTAEEASKMASDGKVDFATFQNAIQDGMGGAALEAGNTVSGSFANMQAALGRVGAKLLGGIFPKLAGGFGGITEWLDRMGPTAERVGEAIGDGMRIAADWVTEAWGRIKTLFKSGDGAGGLAEYRDTVLSVWESVKSIFRSAITLLQFYWNNWGRHVVSTLAAVSAALLPALRALFTIIEGIFNTFAALVKGDWSLLWTGIKQIVTGNLAFTRATISAALTAIQGLFSAAGNAIGNIARAIWDGVKAAFTAGVETAVGIVTGLKGKIDEALVGAATWLLQVGRDVMAGLAKGIGEGVSTVVDKVRSVGDPIVGAFKSVFGTHSPSRVLESEVGVWLLPGVMDGVMKSLPAFERDMKNTLKPKALLPGAGDFSGLGLGVQGVSRLGAPTGSVGAAGGADAPVVGALTITNWEQGTGYFELIAENRIDNYGDHAEMVHRMS